MSAKILVTGATGKQGGAVAHELLARGHAIRALTRTPNKAAPLAAKGAEVAAGDLTDASSLAAALAGIETVFAMGTPFEAGIDAEVRQGEALIEAARKAGVRHVVYTSVGGADRDTGIPHFDSKYKVETALRQSGLEWTILGPVYFMSNLFFPQTLDALKGGVYASPLPADRKLQQIAVQDIGKVGAIAVEGRLKGRRIDLAGDDLDGTATAAALSKALGKPIAYHSFGLGPLEGNHDLHTMYKWFIEVGYDTDLAALRREFPEVGWHTFADWAASTDLSAAR